MQDYRKVFDAAPVDRQYAFVLAICDDLLAALTENLSARKGKKTYVTESSLRKLKDLWNSLPGLLAARDAKKLKEAAKAFVKEGESASHDASWHAGAGAAAMILTAAWIVAVHMLFALTGKVDKRYVEDFDYDGSGDVTPDLMYALYSLMWTAEPEAMIPYSEVEADEEMTEYFGTFWNSYTALIKKHLIA